MFAQLTSAGAKKLVLYVALASDVRVALHDQIVDKKRGQDDAPPPTVDPAKLVEDTAWKELFDTANESIVADGQDDADDADDGSDRTADPVDSEKSVESGAPLAPGELPGFLDQD